MTAAFYRTAKIPISATGLVLIVVAATTAIRLWLGASLELHFDEAYYWYWSKNLQLAYFDHPPAVAWLIRAGTGIFGDSELGVRITGQICLLIALWFLYDATRRIFSLNAALIAVVSAQATLLLGAGSIIMAPDAPLMLFTTIVLWALIRLCLDADPGWWLVVGVAGGGALLSKYTAGLFAAAIGCWLMATPQSRRWLVQPWPWAGLSVSLLCFAPTFIADAERGWASFGKQGGRVTRAGAPALDNLLGYVGGQMGLLTPGLFALLLLTIGIMVRRNRKSPDPLQMLLILWFSVPALFFLAASPFIKIQANWLAPAWPAAFIALACLVERSGEHGHLRRACSWSVGLGATMVALVWLYASLPFGPRFAGDPLSHLTGQRAFAAEIADVARQHKSHQIFSDDYATASSLRFYAPADMQVAHLTAQPRYAGFAAQSVSLPAILVTRRALVPPLIQTFPFTSPSIEVWRNHKGRPSRKYFVFVTG